MFKVTNQITRNERWRNPSEIFCFTFKLDFKKSAFVSSLFILCAG